MALGDGTDYSDQSTEIKKETSMWSTIITGVLGGLFGNRGTTTDSSGDDTALYLMGGFVFLVLLIVIVLAVLAAGRGR